MCKIKKIGKENYIPVDYLRGLQERVGNRYAKILLTLLVHGQEWITTQRIIADHTGIPRSTVVKIMRTLRQQGLIKAKHDQKRKNLIIMLE